MTDYRAGIMSFCQQLLNRGDDILHRASTLLPPEHRVTAFKPPLPEAGNLHDVDGVELLVEGPLLPVVAPNEQPGKVELIMTQDFDEPAQMMRWYGEFSIGLEANGEPRTTTAWLIMECSYRRWNEWRRRDQGEGMLNALLDPASRAFLTRPAKRATGERGAETVPPRALH